MLDVLVRSTNNKIKNIYFFSIERKAIDERRNVELTLESANQMISELRIALSGADGRTSALDTQLARYLSIHLFLRSNIVVFFSVWKELNVMLNIN
jgi:hypothetical protein